MKAFDYYKQMVDYKEFAGKTIYEIHAYLKQTKTEDIGHDKLMELIGQLEWFLEQHKLIMLDHADQWINTRDTVEERNRMANAIISTYTSSKALKDLIEDFKNKL